MPKIQYVEKNLGNDKLALIGAANTIIAEYQAQGFDLTLRQLYYQFVSRDFLPNNQKSYKMLGDVIADGRLVGLVDWYAIVDRTRFMRSVAHWSDPSQAVHSIAGQFRIDKWEDQSYRPEVWIEKDALVGVIQGVCTKMDVPYFSCRGYTSLSEMWGAAQRMQRYVTKGQIPIVFHLGDHDPSGVDMTRDIAKRLKLFLGTPVKVRRLALTMAQVEQYHPPPNFAKLSDTRAKSYVEKYGKNSWELDALEPTVIAALIREAVRSVRDKGKWLVKKAHEKKNRLLLNRVSSRWEEVSKLVE